MDGILNVNKPSGPTSFAIVARLKHLSGESRVGHGGTLDPLASGVLPLFFGQATRLVEYLQEYPKTYRADIELGVSTDSFDAQGNVMSRSGTAHITCADIEAVLPQFSGVIRQIPPVFSALKREGQPLYEMARQGTAPELTSREVTIYRLEMVKYWEPILTLDVECGKGTYIRSLANDLGQVLGVGASLARLERTAYGPFDIKDSLNMPQIVALAAEGTLPSQFKPMDAVLATWPSVVLTEEQEKDLRCGKALNLQTKADNRLRAYGQGGGLAAVLTLDKESGLWRPEKVFRGENSSL